MLKKIGLKFVSNKNNDVEEFFRLWHGHENLRVGLMDFVNNNSNNIIHPDIAPSKDILALAVKSRYEMDEKKIVKTLFFAENKWCEIEPLFYDLVGKIFKKDFSFDKIIKVYVSVLPFFVRNLDEGRVSIPYNTSNENEPVFVLAHELLHVIFYSYIHDNYEELRESLSSKKVWDFSEAINVVIQGQVEWVNIFKIEPSFYPEHEALYLALNKKWEKDKDIDSLIRDFLVNVAERQN